MAEKERESLGAVCMIHLTTSYPHNYYEQKQLKESKNFLKTEEINRCTKKKDSTSNYKLSAMEVVLAGTREVYKETMKILNFHAPWAPPLVN